MLRRARAVCVLAVLVACRTVPKEAERVSPDRSGPSLAAGDPGKRPFGLAEATRGIAGTGPLVATIETSLGALECTLYEEKAPLTVANFVGLARGLRPWKDPTTGTWVERPAYDGTTFHRVIKGFLIQGGDARGDGTGEPGYLVKDEIWPGAKHDRAGLLCMANRGPNTNGAQFFVTDAPAPHLDGGYTIFGECAPEPLVHQIASVPTGPDDRPRNAVVIQRVTVARRAVALGPALAVPAPSASVP
jgi:peptidyl-prolyl cis-trans isomerase A (cyclophilin A)